MAKIDEIYNAVDDFGLITSAEAAQLGMSNAELVQQADKGRLVRVGRGVYRMPIWPFQKEAPYAIAVKSAGEGALLYGESVVALLGLAPTDPSKMWIGVSKRTRRDLGSGVTLVQVKNANPVWLEGIPCQPVAEAIDYAVVSMGWDRAMQAAEEALRQGYISECDKANLEKKRSGL
ncbi:MAG: type IV toxin-antitoxin system AbiEi family antitoxin domain-containing protein [Eggerthellaceae bacterium]|nr:type IV toxin-antitoxin system AbiEi family antitoxin domain-containing protein [Eggerthellaceae bacterium]